MVLSQLSRAVETRGGNKPQLSDLRESGSIEQDADVVMFLHRDWKVGVMQNEQGNSTEYEADLILAKTRNGETPEIKIGFHPSQMRFYDLDKEPFKPKPIQYKDFTEPKSGLSNEEKQAFD